MKYSNADRIDAIGNDDLIALGHEDEQGSTGYVSGVSTVTQIGEKLNNNLEYSTALDTTDKTIIGAINEVNANAGLFDITTSITTPASVQTFSDGGDNIPLKSLVTEILPIQEGSGTPSPSNVRAISGHDSVKVFNSGKNLIFTLHQSFSNQIIINATSSYSTILKKGTYTFSATISKACSLNYRKSPNDTTVIIKAFVTTGNVSFTFTITEDMYNCTFFLYSSQGVSVSDISNAQLELNSTATSYEESKGIRVKTELGQTVYGGSLECVEGALTISKIYWEFDGSSDETWQKVSGTGKFYTVVTDVVKTYNDGKISNIFPFSGSATSSASVTVDKSFYTQRDENTPNYNRVWVYNSDYETYSIEQFRQVLSNQPLQIVADLIVAEQIHTTITGANIPTLSGLNNVYTDCGDIQSLEYFNENGDDISSLVELESGRQIDLVATLVAGQTSLTFTNSQIKADSTIDVYTDTFGVNPTNVTVTAGQVVLTFPAQQSNLGVKVRLS